MVDSGGEMVVTGVSLMVVAVMTGVGYEATAMMVMVMVVMGKGCVVPVVPGMFWSAVVVVARAVSKAMVMGEGCVMVRAV